MRQLSALLKQLMALPCKIGLHAWKQGKDELGAFGMGFESFETFSCTRCPARGNRVKGTGNRFQVDEGGTLIDHLLWP